MRAADRVALCRTSTRRLLRPSVYTARRTRSCAIPFVAAKPDLYRYEPKPSAFVPISHSGPRVSFRVMRPVRVDVDVEARLAEVRAMMG